MHGFNGGFPSRDVGPLRLLGFLLLAAFAVLPAALGPAGAPTAPSPQLAPAVAPAGSDLPSAPSPTAAPLPAPAGAPLPLTPAERQFDARVLATAHALVASGRAGSGLRLPNVGPPARLVDGVVVPGATAAAGHDAFPEGVAYYGESDPAGTVVATSLNASSVAGRLAVTSLTAMYLDSNSPNISGVQLNSILDNVTLQGGAGYDFWTQNALDYFASNATLGFGEDTWNFSSGASGIPTGNSTIAAHSPNGSLSGGIYIGFGPYLPAPTPFVLTLYLNSSRTAAGDQELWYNYSLAATGEPYRSGNYDWVVFNSTNAAHPATVPVAPFYASGSSYNPSGLPYDFELDFGIAAYNGATMDTFAGNLSAGVAYCPIATTPCTPSELRSVPAAEDFGSQTGETGAGLSFSYANTTAVATGGPGIETGLWGYGGESGNAPGSTPVRVAISTSGSPDGAGGDPYAFVFLNDTSAGSAYAWAPDLPEWHLMPGTYSYLVMLADYGARFGEFTVGTTPTNFSTVLVYSNASGVYTPLWAFDNAELGPISSAGSGTLAGPYTLFRNPTAHCTACDGAPDGNLSGWFFDYNDYLYPTFPGVFLSGTSAYVTLDRPPSFTVYNESGGSGSSAENWYFDLPIELYHVSHVTVSNATGIGTWPTMFEILMIAPEPAAQNPFPQGNVIVWGSTSVLIRGNRFTTESEPGATCGTGGACPPLRCNGCVPPDELLLYGGRNNTVWGNTFEDPAGASLSTGAGAVYAGLAEAESGDLLYNNNLSVDNPAMLMAYDLFNDSCWAGYAGQCTPLITPSYHDTWNVSNQSATDVARTVNGFPLSGNVLGPQYRLQGGNFWWDWGNALNPYGTVPFTNVFDYTQNATNLPPGYPAVESSLRVGGDFAPLRLGYLGPPAVSVTFTESGLPAGTDWSVTLGGATRSSGTPTIVFSETAGSYAYSVAPLAGFEPPANGSVSVAGAPVGVPIAFVPRSPPTYPVTFSESGLSAGTSWSVTLHGTTNRSSGPAIGFAEPSGTYGYSVGAPAGYARLANGSVTVSAAPVAISLRFVAARPATYLVGFSETGLPTGSAWSVSVNGTVENGSGSQISAALANGSYPFTVPVSAGGYLPNPGRGNLTVDGAPVAVRIAFARPSAGPAYTATFEESGLPVGSRWSVSVNGANASAAGSSILFELTNGTYRFVVGGPASYAATPANGSVRVDGSNVTLRVAFASNATAPASSPGDTYYYLVGGAIGAVAVGAAAVWVLRRRPPSPEPALAAGAGR